MKEAFILALILLFSVTGRSQNPPPIDLNGLWKEGSRKVEIMHRHGNVFANFIDPRMCNPRNGKEPEELKGNFSGSLAGRVITGKALVCNWGEEWGGEAGIQKVDMMLEVNAEGDELSGTYKGWKGPVKMTLTRCPQFVPKEDEVKRFIIDALHRRGVILDKIDLPSGPELNILPHGVQKGKKPNTVAYGYIVPLPGDPQCIRCMVTLAIEVGVCEGDKLDIRGVFIWESPNGPKSATEGAVVTWEGAGYDRNSDGLRRAIDDVVNGLRVRSPTGGPGKNF